eukprot:10274805-Lingulodinium_polyedra.AAC.1
MPDWVGSASRRMSMGSQISPDSAHHPRHEQIEEDIAEGVSWLGPPLRSADSWVADDRRPG